MNNDFISFQNYCNLCLCLEISWITKTSLDLNVWTVPRERSSRIWTKLWQKLKDSEKMVKNLLVNYLVGYLLSSHSLEFHIYQVLEKKITKNFSLIIKLACPFLDIKYLESTTKETWCKKTKILSIKMHSYLHAQQYPNAQVSRLFTCQIKLWEVSIFLDHEVTNSRVCRCQYGGWCCQGSEGLGCQGERQGMSTSPFYFDNVTNQMSLQSRGLYIEFCNANHLFFCAWLGF